MIASGVLALLAVAILVGLLLTIRDERLAAAIGRYSARVARRFRADADPDEWSRALVDFRAQTQRTLRGGLAPPWWPCSRWSTPTH